MDFTKLLRPENVKLRVHSGRAKVKRLENEDLFCFTKDWPSFAEDSGLQLGEFLVFSLVREWEFDVAMYDTSFCEREIPDQLNPHGTNVKNATYGSSKESNPLYLEICLNERQHQSRVFVCKRFLDAEGLNGKKSVKLEYAGNDSSKCVALNKHQHRIDLATGWPEFRRENRLGYGKTYSFQFIPDHNVIRVEQVVKKPKPQVRLQEILECGGPWGQKVCDTQVCRQKQRQRQIKGRGSCKSVVLNKDGHRIDIARGWPEFWKANGLDIGETYCFQFIPDHNVIHVDHVMN